MSYYRWPKCMIRVCMELCRGLHKFKVCTNYDDFSHCRDVDEDWLPGNFTD